MAVRRVAAIAVATVIGTTPIALFRSDDVPVSLGLLIDNSGSMRSKRSKVEAAGLAFARASNPRDEIFVLNFADKPKIDVRFTRPGGL